MNFQGLIKNLQDKPYETRTRILWMSTLIAAIIVIAIWVIGFRQEFNNLNKQSILGSNTQKIQITAPHYANVEAADEINGKLFIYFVAKNDTNDILNFSQASDITLVVDGKSYGAAQLTDRQNQPFVQKILSHTHNFGVASFEVTGVKSGQLTFGGLNFENNPINSFKEQSTIDFKKLNKPDNIRN